MENIIGGFMRAVFLDASTFSKNLSLSAPEGLSDWVVYERTACDAVIERLQGADIAVVNKVVLSADVLEALPELKLVQVSATGVNNVDLEAAQRLGIKVMNVEGYSVQSVSEHVLMFMFAALRGLKPYHQAVEDFSWTRDGRFCLTEPPILDVFSRTLGVVGAGAVGRTLSEKARALGMRVLWAEHRGRMPRSADYVRFEEVLERSDVLVFSCPLNEKTHHLFSGEILDLLGRKPLVINVSRGGVVDTKAVVKALLEDRILGFCGDVFEREPVELDEDLLKVSGHPRVWLTPHVAWASQKAQAVLWQILCKQVADFVKNYGG